IFVSVESTFTILLPKNGGMWTGYTTTTITYIDISVNYALIGTATTPDTTIRGNITLGSSTSTTDNHGFIFLLTTSNSIAIDSCLLCQSIRYLNVSLTRDTYGIGFANPNNVDYYLTISLKLSPSVTTSPLYYPTNAFNPPTSQSNSPSSPNSPISPNSPGSDTSQQNSSSGNPLLVGVGISAGVLLVVGILALIGFLIYNKRRRQPAIIEMPGSDSYY
ncbi:12644_t:CDS:2, partial [Cetraspora pellucida]